MRLRAGPRRGFSLLEMVTALAIGFLLLGALYTTLTMQFGQAQAGRDVSAEGVVARSILTRIGNDISTQIGPFDPRMQQAAAANSSGTGSTTGTGTSTATATSASSSGTSGQTITPSTVTFNVGVQGDGTNLMISGYRVQPPLPGTTANPPTEPSSDLRVVAYWLVAGGNGTDQGGLARREFKQATAQDINTLPSSYTDQNTYIIAEEVSYLLFEYFDGTNWQSTWDGTTTQSDGVTPTGPPVAIRITIRLRHAPNNGAGNNADDQQGPEYQHIVAIPSANYTNPQTNSSSP